LEAVNNPFSVPGQFELNAARRFFFALDHRDERLLAALLDERPSFHNVDGPVPVQGGEALARTLVAREPGVAYELFEVAAQPGRADARFVLLVDGVPGGIVLEAVLGFAGARIASIHVHQP
jgi:hypothetical protein